MNIFSTLLPTNASLHSALAKHLAAAPQHPSEGGYAQNGGASVPASRPFTGPVTSADLKAAPLAPVKTLESLIARVIAFQHSRFHGQSLQGKLNHLVKESQELAADPTDPSEWADVLILLIGSADLAGYDLAGLVESAHAKMDVNESREWNPPDALGCYHHKKD